MWRYNLDDSFHRAKGECRKWSTSENDQHGWFRKWSPYINCGNNFEENDQHIKKLAVAFGKSIETSNRIWNYLNLSFT